MNKLFARIALYTSLAVAGIWVLTAQDKTQPTMSVEKTPPAQPEKPIKKSDAEWRKKLTPEQYRIARQGGTERRNGEVYKQFKKQGAGTYYCVGCNAELFSSKEKFDSRCGWPSFYDPSKAKNVKTLLDLDGSRTEVRCKVCDAHLGHVFHGEGFATPTDKRFCINGTVLKFVSAEDIKAAKQKAAAKKPEANPATKPEAKKTKPVPTKKEDTPEKKAK